jgi:BAAT / Acyl-CoA thioester hydrolase C terminal
VSSIRRTEIRTGGTVGVVFEPEEGSDQFAVMLGGSYGGIPEGPARRLPRTDERIRPRLLRRAWAASCTCRGPDRVAPARYRIVPREICRWTGRRIGGVLKGGRAGAPPRRADGRCHRPGRGRSAVACRLVRLKPPGPDLDRRSSQSSWSLHGAPLPFLPCPPDVLPVFTERGLRTDAFMDLSRYEPVDVDAARIPVERSAGPILLLSGDDDHQWSAAPMAKEIVRRMEDHGRGNDVTNVVYLGAGHVFFVQDFVPPPEPGTGAPFDFGGSTEADLVAGKDAWQRAVSCLLASGVAD